MNFMKFKWHIALRNNTDCISKMEECLYTLSVSFNETEFENKCLENIIIEEEKNV